MRAPATPVLDVCHGDDPAGRNAVYNGLKTFNAAHSPFPGGGPLSIYLRDPETGEVQGGLVGRVMQFWLYVEVLFIPEAWRGQDIGTQLLQRAEAETRARGGIGMWLDTYDFQAPGFYLKQGFVEFGAIADHPPGQFRRFYMKRFA